MQTTWEQDGETRSVIAPVSLIVSAFTPVGDVRRTLTPQLRTDRGDTSLIFIDLWAGRQRLGGSVMAQAYGQVGDEVPDIDDAGMVKAFFQTLRALANEGLVLAYHDRSDGGLLATVCEMAFAGHVGVSVNLDMFTIDPYAEDWGDFKIRPEQVAVQRDERSLHALFNEEAGAVLQVRRSDRDIVMRRLREAGLSRNSYVLGGLNDVDEIQVFRDGKCVYQRARAQLGQQWSEV